VLAAALGGFASVDAQAFYQGPIQPAWAPPASVFGPVSTVLYLAMCAAAWLAVRAAGLPAARPAPALYAARLALDGL
jgi:tryptophan-rich sensory protein